MKAAVRRIAFVCSGVAVAVAGCSPRSEAFVAWTIDGAPAAQTCAQLLEPQVRIRMENADAEGAASVDEVATAACADGKASVLVGNVSRLVVEVLDGGEVYGAADALETAPGLTAAYPGHAPDEPLEADIVLERGRLQAELTVVGKSCADAGAAAFDVILRRSTSPLRSEIVVDDATVTCPDDGAAAVFTYAPVILGSRYEVVATTSIGDVAYATEDGGGGEGVLASRGLTDVAVDLDVVGRP